MAIRNLSHNSPLTPSYLKRGEGELPRYVLLLNSDVEVSLETFDKMINYMDNNPAVGIAGCKVLKPGGKLDLACRRSFPNPVNALWRILGLSFLFPKSRVASYNLTYLSEDEIAEVDSVMGAFLMIRREVIEKIGLLDEDFFMYGEDLDWCYRAKQAGYKVMYAPITSVVHYKGSSSRKASRLALYEFHRAMQIFYDKHYREQYNFLVNFFVRVGIWIRYLVKLIANTLRSEKYVSK
ncbi:MAG: glycosyltransferase family 2 protein [Candidatus Doudnabacteria bacterium]|nr:glycosyltransferase family 2 protein [Candidatus Doudnabacteria bacterium]